MGRISALTELTTLASNDYLIVLDSSANIAKKITVANAFGIPDFGFTASGETWTYSSFNSTLGTGVITVPTDATTKYTKGMWVRFSQTTGGTKYGKIIAITSTSITVQFPSGTTLVNETISTPVYSVVQTPYGVPEEKDFIYSYANAGNAGGTFYFKNWNGIKEVYGASNTLTTTGVGPKTFNVNFPTGFFSSVKMGKSSTRAVTTYAEQYSHLAGAPSTSSSAVYIVNARGASGATASFFAQYIGD